MCLVWVRLGVSPPTEARYSPSDARRACATHPLDPPTRLLVRTPNVDGSCQISFMAQMAMTSSNGVQVRGQALGAPEARAGRRAGRSRSCSPGPAAQDLASPLELLGVDLSSSEPLFEDLHRACRSARGRRVSRAELTDPPDDRHDDRGPEHPHHHHHQQEAADPQTPRVVPHLLEPPPPAYARSMEVLGCSL